MGSASEGTAAERFEAASAKLRRAEAFSVPGVDALRQEVAALEQLVAQVSPPAEAEAAKRTEAPAAGSAAPPQGRPARLSFESLQAMSDEQRIAAAQELGPAFGLSVIIVAFCYWSVCLPLFLVAYHEGTGAWPTFEDLTTLDAARTAGAVAGLLSLAALLKPLRLLAAALLTPWTAENIVPRLPWAGKPDDGRS